MEKITNVSALELAIATLATVDDFPTEAIQKLQNVKASYEKKSTSPKKPTATQLANDKLKLQILDLMEFDVKYTVTDISKILDAEYSNQKLSRLLNDMAKDNLIDKVADKRKSYFVVKP